MIKYEADFIKPPPFIDVYVYVWDFKNVNKKYISYFDSHNNEWIDSKQDDKENRICIQDVKFWAEIPKNPIMYQIYQDKKERLKKMDS